MMRRPQIVLLPDGRRLHLQDGPIDLVIEACGDRAEVEIAYAAAAESFTGLLDKLCDELPELRRRAAARIPSLKGVVARRMHAAVAPYADTHFITPMAAVAGAVAEDVLDAMTRAATLTRAYVNNGGDIALHLSPGQQFTVGLVAHVDPPTLAGRTVVDADSEVRGIATSGRHGRSFSLGIADAVTVLARTASQADAAATMIANAVDLPNHPGITRAPACEIQPDNDLGERLVTRDVAPLTHDEVMMALERGTAYARELLSRGLIEGATLCLQGEMQVVAPIHSPAFDISHSRAAIVPPTGSLLDA
ncbi:MAG: UPF0280 family protein [Rhizobiales bacterium]|nr:UPF0280 family protein [Hyphomicrobiales bacterium]